MSNLELKPCPWCGKTPTMMAWTDYSTRYRVTCFYTDCTIQPGTGPLFDRKEEAAKAWNQRVYD